MLAVEFDDARLLRPLFLLLRYRLLNFLLLFRTWNIDRALGRNFYCKGHASKTEKDPVAHLSETESSISTSRESRRRRRDRPR